MRCQFNEGNSDQCRKQTDGGETWKLKPDAPGALHKADTLSFCPGHGMKSTARPKAVREALARLYEVVQPPPPPMPSIPSVFKQVAPIPVPVEPGRIAFTLPEDKRSLLMAHDGPMSGIGGELHMKPGTGVDFDKQLFGVDESPHEESSVAEEAHHLSDPSRQERLDLIGHTPDTKQSETITVHEVGSVEDVLEPDLAGIEDVELDGYGPADEDPQPEDVAIVAMLDTQPKLDAAAEPGPTTKPRRRKRKKS